jgi:hypothetical protein
MDNPFLPTDREATDKEKEIAELLVKLNDKLRKTPDIVSATTLAKSLVDNSTITAEDLMSAGFKPSYVSIPEIGQDSVTSYRHPESLLHFHSHPDLWLYHEDNNPSLDMLLTKYKKEHPNASKVEKLKYLLLDALPGSIEHTVNDGAPALADYLGKILRGAPSETQAGNKNVKQYNIAKALMNSALVTGIMTGLEMLVNKKAKLGDSLISNASAVGSFALSQSVIANLLNKNKKQFKPSLGNTMLLFGAPMSAGVGGKIAALKILEELRKEKK